MSNARSAKPLDLSPILQRWSLAMEEDSDRIPLSARESLRDVVSMALEIGRLRREIEQKTATKTATRTEP